MDPNLWWQDNTRKEKGGSCVHLLDGTEIVPEARNGPRGLVFLLWHLHGAAALVHDVHHTDGGPNPVPTGVM